MSVIDKQYIEVRNLTGQTVAYKIEEDNIRRVFEPHEVKKITAEELRKAAYKYGNNVLFQDYLCINNKELAEELGVPEDAVEYWWTKEDIDRVLIEGSMDEFLDALDYGPKGIVNAIKDRAIQIKLNSMEKRKAILDKLGFDITKIIELQDAVKVNNETDTQEPKKSRRRVNREETDQTEGRRVSD